MKFAECICKDCTLEFKISFNNGTPEFVHCPNCTSQNIKLHWIDRAGINSEM